MLNVEKFLHEVGLGVKGQSNLVIAGSPRNSFRASVGKNLSEGRALNMRWPHPAVLSIIKLRMSRCHLRQSDGE